MRVNESSHVEQYDGMRADYSAAKQSRFKRQRRGLLPYGSNNDWSLRVPTDYYTIQGQIRDMVRNDVLIGQMIVRACENILGDGPRPDPQTGDRGLDRELRDRWRDYECDPNQVDAAGEQDFYGMCFLNLQHMLVDGDVFDLLLRDGPIQIVESHRCREIAPGRDDIALGVELSKSRKAIAYHFVPDVLSPMQSGFQGGEGKRYPSRDSEGERVICHVLDRRRSSQTRGMSPLTCCVDTGGMVDDHIFATLVQAQVQSCYAMIHELDTGADPTGGLDQQGSRGTSPNSDGTSQTTEALGPGMRIAGKPGEKIKGFSPAVPGSNHFEHVKLLINFISINLGMPLILALLDASETNFSAWRGALEQAREGFRRLQRVLRSRFLVPSYRWKVRQWMAEDGLARAMWQEGHVDPLRHKWNRPAFPYIDPLKDAQADSHRLENGLVSPRRLFHEQGQEWGEHVIETIDDLSLAIVRAKRRAQKINARFPQDDPVVWRDLLYLPNPAGVTTRITPKAALGYGSPADEGGTPSNGRDPQAPYDIEPDEGGRYKLRNRDTGRIIHVHKRGKKAARKVAHLREEHDKT